MNLVKNLSKHPSVSVEILVKDCGGIDAILTCIKDFDPMVRESALQAISSIARQDANISKFIATSGKVFVHLCGISHRPDKKKTIQLY